MPIVHSHLTARARHARDTAALTWLQTHRAAVLALVQDHTDHTMLRAARAIGYEGTQAVLLGWLKGQPEYAGLIHDKKVAASQKVRQEHRKRTPPVGHGWINPKMDKIVAERHASMKDMLKASDRCHYREMADFSAEELAALTQKLQARHRGGCHDSALARLPWEVGS